MTSRIKDENGQLGQKKITQCQIITFIAGNPRLTKISAGTVRKYSLCNDHFETRCFLNADKIKLRWNAVPIPCSNIQRSADITATTSAFPNIDRRSTSGSTDCITCLRTFEPDSDSGSKKKVVDTTSDDRTVAPVPLICAQLNTEARIKDATADSIIMGINDEDSYKKNLRTYHHNQLTFDDTITDEMEWIRIEPPPVLKAKAVRTIVSKPTMAARKKLRNKKRQSQVNLLKKNRRLQDIVKRLRQTIRQLRRKLERTTTKEAKIKKRITVDEFLNEKECFNPSARAMIKLQLHKRNAPYARDEIDLAKQLYYHSAAAFIRLRKGGCNFPATSTMKMWIAEYDITTGFCDIIFEKLAEKLCTMPMDERVCALKWDEMSIKDYEEYSTKFDAIEGLVDLGPLGRRYKRAKHIFVFCVDSLNAKNPWRQPIAYFLPGTGMTSEEIGHLVKVCLQKLKDAGANVKLLTCDQGVANQQAYSSIFKVTANKPTCNLIGDEIFASFDFPHLVKRLLSQLRCHKTLYCNGKVIAAYQDFEDTWIYDSANGTSNLLSHISEAHLHPNGFEAMNVKRAFQILSHTYASAIKLAGNDKNGLKSSTWEATADFAETMNCVIDACNAYKLTFRNPQKRPLSERNPQIEELLTDFIDWSSKWSTSPIRLQRAPCLQGLELTVRAILSVYKSIAEELPGFELAAGLCNQDSVEHFFSKLRQRGGHNPNPTARMVRLSIRHILATGYIHGSDRANVQCDEARSLLNPVTTEVARAFEVVNEPESLEGYKDIEETDECDVRAAVHAIERYECDELEGAGEDSTYELNAINYMAGYDAYKTIDNMNCNHCRDVMLKSPMEEATDNEIYTREREYENENEDAPGVTKLKRPTA